MSFPKREFYCREDQELSDRSLALSHPARLFIIRTLRREGPKFVHELEKLMPLVQSSISHHLEKLREHGILQVEVHRLENLYHLDLKRYAEVAEEYASWFKEILEGEGTVESRVSEMAEKRA